MKLLEFQIERYGAIKDRTVVFDPQCGLVVVYGPNEIGKSTLLSAVSDFCFGVPNNSPHGSVFGYDAIQLRARLRLSDGAELNLRRRKGRGKTLTDDAGGSLDQDALGRALGATTRERFLSHIPTPNKAMKRCWSKRAACQALIPASTSVAHSSPHCRANRKRAHLRFR
ncbi:MAG: AAA family ATPase [Caulobacteraceae bacterium]|nr:AAA family ATPase [Caulobacteraceae bacterium]